MRHFTASVSDKRGCRLMPAIISITTACTCQCVSRDVCTYVYIHVRVCFHNRVY